MKTCDALDEAPADLSDLPIKSGRAVHSKIVVLFHQTRLLRIAPFYAKAKYAPMYLRARIHVELHYNTDIRMGHDEYLMWW